MKKEKDIVDYLHEKKLLENKLSELINKKELLPAEKTIIEEIKYELRRVNSIIAKY